MKPQKTFYGTIEGDLDGYDIEMDLDLSPEGRAHLLSLMTDLYSDQEMAVLREYSTNALDAHIEVGETRPIEVVLPTSLSQYLVIRDFGPGLSVNDLETVYSKYGASTKRGSDAVNGMLGLGGKSALTYTTQFMVTSVKNGVKAQVVVTRNEDGIGVMKVVDTRSTTDPSGVEIRIPVKASHDFHEKAEQLFYYWKPGTVLVNGKQPRMMMAETHHTKIGDRVYVIADRNTLRRSYSTDIVVMGNVPYPLRDKPFTSMVSENYWATSIVFVEMGDITFAPSREAVSYTPKTVATIERIQKEIVDGIKTSIEKQLLAANSYSDAFKVWHKWGGIVGLKNLPKMQYKGEEFQTVIRHKHSYCKVGGGRYNWRTSKTANSYGTENAIDMSVLLSDKTLIVTGYSNATPPAGNSRQKVQQYLDNNPLDIRYIIFTEETPGLPWTKDVETIDWTEISSIRLNNGANGGGGKTGTIPVLIWQRGNWVNTKDIDQSKPIVYFSPTDDDSYRHNMMQTMLSTIPDIQFILIGANRWNKFRRENPTAVDWSAYKHQYSKAVAALMTADELFHCEHDGDYISFAAQLKNSDDPTFARLANCKVDSQRVREYHRVVGAKVKHVLAQDYPLLANHYGGRIPTDHALLYVNAVFAKKGN